MLKNVQIRKRIAVLSNLMDRSGNSLGIDAGLGNGTVDKWTDKHLDVSNVFVAKFLKHYNIDPQWWQTGDGEVFLKHDEKADNNGEMVPKHLFDLIIKSNEAEKTALEKNRILEIEALNKEYKLAVQGLQNKAERLQLKVDQLEKEKAKLLRQIAGKIK